jgi:hypothetical protein
MMHSEAERPVCLHTPHKTGFYNIESFEDKPPNLASLLFEYGN